MPAARLLAFPATDPTSGLTVLTPAEWRTLAALVDQVWPRTGALPSATEAGVLTYLHRRFTGDLPGYRIRGRPAADPTLAALYRKLCARTDALAGGAFSALPPSARKPVVERLSAGSKADVGYHVVGSPDPATARDPELFALLRRHVLEGTFCDPRSGGNRDYRAWEGIGHVCHSNYPRPHRCDPVRKQHR